MILTVFDTRDNGMRELVGFMGNGDLWGLEFMVLIFHKSRLGFMGGPSVIESSPVI